MDFKNLHEKENSLFNRKEIIFSMSSEKTPTKKEMQKLIAEKFSKEPEIVKVNHIYGKFGSRNFEIHAFVYNSKKDYEKAEGEIQEVQEEKIEGKSPEKQEQAKETEEKETKKESKEQEENPKESGKPEGTEEKLEEKKEITESEESNSENKLENKS